MEPQEVQYQGFGFLSRVRVQNIFCGPKLKQILLCYDRIKDIIWDPTRLQWPQNKEFMHYTAHLGRVFLWKKTASIQGCHIGRLSGKSRPKDVVRARPDVPASGRTSESADRWRTAQADGQSWGRAHNHPTKKQPGTS
jgi:hypothetical protein